MDAAPRTEARWQLPEAHTRALAALGTQRRVERGRIVIQEGDLGDCLYVILEGQVRVYLADDEGREIWLNRHFAGEHFGEMMLDGGIRSATVVTVDPCVFSVVTREQLRTYLAEHPDCAHALILLLMARIRKLTSTVGSLALLDVHGRVARLLLSLATVGADGVRRVEEKLTQADIASRVGATREMVGRTLKGLRAGGYIEVDGSGRHVIKADPPIAC